MAIGKVNAYATVEAPKADFGAVAQLNIDNLVKSAKEDEQLKAAKKAAEDKAKQERVKDLGIFPDMTATGATGADSSNIRQASEGLKMWNEYNRDWVENGNYDSKAKAAALINHYKNLNNQMSELQKGAANFGTLAGQDKVNPKDKAYTMDLLKSSENGLTQFGFDKDTNPKVGIYKMSEDGTTKEFVKSMDYNEYYKNIFTPVANIDISEKANDAKQSFEKSLTEKFPGLIKTGIKELSKDTKDAIYKMALSEVENDQFMYVAGDKYNVIAKDDYKKSGFDPKDKEKVARAYADEIIGKFGIDKEITKMQPSKGDGDGSGSKTRTPLTLTTLTDVDFFGNKDDEGNNLDNYAIGMKSKVLSGISGTEKKSMKYIIPSFDKWSANNKEGVSKPTGEKMTDYVVTDFAYDNKGRPTVRGNYINTKSKTYKAALLDATQRLKKQREELKSGETDEEINNKAESELALNSELYDLERENHVQQIGKVEEQKLVSWLVANKGKINGIRIKDVPSVKRAMGYNSTVKTPSSSAAKGSSGKIENKRGI